MSFYSARTIKASRKPKRCWWCGDWIKVGEPKVYVAGYWEDFWTSHSHPECHEAELKWTKENPEDAAEGCYEAGDFKRGSTELRTEEGA